tara:strand:+ start:315 stop:914 length:600 start_codon:yes stop_codon:yes gene_type:complete
MSHIPFHKWGKQNNDQTQNLVNDVTLGSGASQNKMIKPGEALFYSYQSGTYTYVENSRVSAGNWGCFKDATSIELLANTTSILARRWVQAYDATDGRVDEGKYDDRVYCIGVSINSNNTGSASDSIAVQTSGICQIAWHDTESNADIGRFIRADVTNDGNVSGGSTGAASGDFGVIVNEANAGTNTGYVWVKLNLLELY